VHLELVGALENVEIGTQSTTPYASLFFTDDALLANHHILGDEGRIALVLRKDNGLWALPGGVMQLGAAIQTVLWGLTSDPPRGRGEESRWEALGRAP
jgi:8-oxo-dGTP pyrophosphatase MutT (NUDIX family)